MSPYPTVEEDTTAKYSALKARKESGGSTTVSQPSGFPTLSNSATVSPNVERKANTSSAMRMRWRWTRERRRVGSSQRSREAQA
jgi:hypothetical protein